MGQSRSQYVLDHLFLQQDLRQKSPECHYSLSSRSQGFDRRSVRVNLTQQRATLSQNAEEAPGQVFFGGIGGNVGRGSRVQLRQLAGNNLPATRWPV
jgi:hypothetical protein